MPFDHPFDHSPSDACRRYAGVGGLSELMGWTEVHEAEGKVLFGGVDGVLKVVLAILLADGALFLYENVVAFQSGDYHLIPMH